MMTNFTLNQQDTKQLKHCISDLFTQMTADYRETRMERQQLTVAMPPADDFSLIEELELLTANLRGYASQIQLRGWIEDRAMAIIHLQTLRLFSIPTISEFYFETGKDYPKLQDYVRKLDYLRLLLLEYLQADSQVEAI
jgi:hypothetical protein